MELEAYVKALEARIAALEEKLTSFSVTEHDGDIHITNCPLQNVNILESQDVYVNGPIGNVYLNDCTDISMEQCSIGGCFTEDVEEAECMIEDLESRLEDIRGEIETLSEM